MSSSEKLPGASGRSSTRGLGRTVGSGVRSMARLLAMAANRPGFRAASSSGALISEATMPLWWHTIFRKVTESAWRIWATTKLSPRAL